MKKKLLFTAIMFTCIATTKAQNVNIPDANFKAYLVGNLSINTNADSEIQLSEAQAIGYLDVSAMSIADLTGISAFTNLSVLYCQGNQLTSLDVSSNLLLVNFYCANNQITSLDLSAHTALQDFRCATNLLTSLNIKNGNNTSITVFTANGNPDLTCIEVDDAAYSTTNWTYVDVTSSFSEDCLAGLGDNALNEPILVYPNPVENTLFLSGVYSVLITDLTGKVIVQEDNTNTINISNQPSGVYMISLADNEGKIVYRGKVIKE